MGGFLWLILSLIIGFSDRIGIFEGYNNDKWMILGMAIFCMAVAYILRALYYIHQELEKLNKKS